MFLMKEWELFYTDAKDANPEMDLVDQISIDVINKRFILDINASSMVTDGEDEMGEEIFSTYVSRTIFDILLEGVKAQGYKKMR